MLASRGGYIDAAYGQSRPAGYGQPIPIAPGQRITDVEIRMWRHAVITGTVLDEAGEPVIGIRVQAMGGGHVAGRRRYGAGASGTTDDRGVYRIAQLVPGDYLVAVPSKQTSIPTEVMDVFFAGGTTRAQRDELGRELATIDAPVVPAGSRYATSSGAVDDPAGPRYRDAHFPSQRRTAGLPNRVLSGRHERRGGRVRYRQVGRGTRQRRHPAAARAFGASLGHARRARRDGVARADPSSACWQRCAWRRHRCCRDDHRCARRIHVRRRTAGSIYAQRRPRPATSCRSRWLEPDDRAGWRRRAPHDAAGGSHSPASAGGSGRRDALGAAAACRQRKRCERYRRAATGWRADERTRRIRRHRAASRSRGPREPS